jgi:hypothetical protein
MSDESVARVDDVARIHKSAPRRVVHFIKLDCKPFEGTSLPSGSARIGADSIDNLEESRAMGCPLRFGRAVRTRCVPVPGSRQSFTWHT